MKRTTVTIPDQVGTVLEREAHRRAPSVSEIVRQAPLAYFGLDGGQPWRLPFAALGRSGHCCGGH
jgi:hypothetical protein